MRILREIGTEPFHAGAREPHPWRPEALAKRLRESPRLVKDRVARLEKSGVIAAYEVLPDPAALGLSMRTYALRSPTPASKAGAADKLRAVEGVIALVDFLDEWAHVSIAFRDEAELAARLARVRGALGGATPVVHFAPRPDRPRVEPLTRTDWRLVRALRGDAKRPVHRVAKSLGVTTKTVQRRLHKLTTGGAIDSFARLGPRGFEEVLFATLKFRLQKDAVMPAMQHIHGELFGSAWALCAEEVMLDDAHYDLLVAPRSPKGLRDLVERASRIPGVVEVEGHVATELVWMPDWIDREIERRASAS